MKIVTQLHLHLFNGAPQSTNNTKLKVSYANTALQPLWNALKHVQWCVTFLCLLGAQTIFEGESAKKLAETAFAA